MGCTSSFGNCTPSEPVLTILELESADSFLGLVINSSALHEKYREKEDFCAKAQSAAAFLSGFFAPLREKQFPDDQVSWRAVVSQPVPA